MQKKENIFSRSAAEMKSVRCLAVTALFIAINVTLDLLNIRIQLTESLRIGIGFLCNASIAMLYGPVVGMSAGFCTDVLGYMVNSGGGAYFPGYTLTAVLGGLLYGLLLYPQRPAKLRVIAAKASINLLCNVGLNTLWSVLLQGSAVAVILPVRAVKNLVLLPFEAVLLYAVLRLVLSAYRRTMRAQA